MQLREVSLLVGQHDDASANDTVVELHDGDLVGDNQHREAYNPNEPLLIVPDCIESVHIIVPDIDHILASGPVPYNTDAYGNIPTVGDPVPLPS